ALPGADADLGDQEVLRPERELAAHAAPVDARMELRGVRPRIDDLDLVGVDALLHEALLDRFADRDDGRDASGRVAETVERIEPEADAAVQDQDREPHEQA